MDKQEVRRYGDAVSQQLYAAGHLATCVHAVLGTWLSSRDLAHKLTALLDAVEHYDKANLETTRMRAHILNESRKDGEQCTMR